jgi:hypothetical protein
MNQLPPPQQMFQFVTGYWVTQLMGTAARLGLADRLEAGPLAVTDLATKVGANADALYRVMRACTAVGVFAEQPGRTFANTPLSQTLRANVPGSMRDFAIAQSSAGHWRPWERLEDAVKTGQRTTVPVLGREIFEWYGNHPEEAAAFSGAMHDLAAQVSGELTHLIDFSTATKVVDVGGANGTLVSAVLRAFPKTQGVLFELPHALETAKKALAADGVAERCEVVGGDFFTSVPKGDVMVLKQILHDWSDEQCVTLLKNCAASLPVGGVDGTLAKRWHDHAARGRVRAKTGTLDKVIALAGYVGVDGAHELAFVIVANDIPGGQRPAARALADEMVDAMVAYLTP